MLFTNAKGINIYANENVKKESISMRDSLKIDEFKPEITNKIISNYSAKNTSEGSVIIDIPDENLKAGINNALGKNSDEDITKAELESIESLNLFGLGIKNLKGIENCINLTSLNLNFNGINDISALSNLTNLNTLDLYNNEISDISVLGNLTNLIYLHLSDNKIEDISVLSNLTGLYFLSLGNNEISDISVLSNLRNLIGLSMEGNNIEDISVLEKLHYIERLDISDNKIKDITSIRNLTNLNTLYMRQNSIEDISVLHKLKNIEMIVASYNEIDETIHLSELNKLKILELNNNKIEDISGLSNLTNLEDLSLGNNKIGDISGLSDLINLQRLYLYNNEIRDISILNKLKNLTSIDISYNKIEDISGLSNLTNLEHLNLYDNKIKDIVWVRDLTGLTHLNLNGNEIEDISPLSNLTNLVTLFIGDNNIDDISPICNLTNLRWLDLYGNKIENISELSNLTNLIGLGLENTSLKVNDILPLSDLEELDILNISYNDIESIEGLSNFKNLYELHIDNNRITDLTILDDLKELGYGEFGNQNIELEPVYTTSSIIKVNIPSVYDNKGNKLDVTTSNSTYSIDGDNLIFENIQDTKEITFGFSTQLAFIDERRFNYDVQFHQPVIKLVEGVEVENKGQATELEPVVFSIKTDKSADQIIKKLNESKYTYTLVDKPRIENNNKIYKLRLNEKVKQEISDKFIEFKVSLDNKQIIEKLDNTFGVTSQPTIPEEPTPEQPKPEEPPTDNNTGTKPPTNNTVNFSDIENHWAKSTIKEFASKGYIVGYEDKTFKPDTQMTRAEFIKLVNKTLGYTSKGENHFKDVNENQWFYNNVCIAIKQGYINGKSKDEFAPNDKITRQEVAMILTNIYKNKDNNIDKLNKFKDGTNVDEWAKSSVEGLIEAGYLSGYEDNTIKAKGNITRAEATVILSRVINK